MTCWGWEKILKSDDFTKIKMRMCSKQGIKPVTFNKRINDLSIMVSILYTWVSYQKCFLTKVQTALVGQNLVFDMCLFLTQWTQIMVHVFSITHFEIPIYVFYYIFAENPFVFVSADTSSSVFSWQNIYKKWRKD